MMVISPGVQELDQAQKRKDRESSDAPWFQDGTLESVRVRENPIWRYGAGMRLPTLLALTLALTGCEALIICTGDQVKEGTLCVDPVDGGGEAEEQATFCNSERPDWVCTDDGCCCLDIDDIDICPEGFFCDTAGGEGCIPD